jgi:putative ABC transport system permease protein
MIKDYVKISWREIKRRRLRSWLTLLGIIIGIAAVTSLITLGQGLENAISKQFQGLGDDKLFITAKGSALTSGLSIEAVKITDKDLKVIERSSGIKEVAGYIYSAARIEFNDNVRYFFISGMPEDPEERKLIGEAQNFKILKGRSIDKGDKFKAVLGNEYLNENLFGVELSLGDKIKIQDYEFKIIGFLERIGSPPDDQSVMVPLDTFREIFDKEEELGMVIAQTQPGEDINLVAERVERNLRKHRNLDEGEEDFSVETPNQLMATFNTILNIVQAVLIGIAAISLLVGGIGIMNTMFTTILQRTKEIGVLKAIGARNEHILTLFLIESGFYGLGGGLIGVTIGISLAKIVEKAFIAFLGPALLSVEIDPLFILATLIFSFVVGCLSGVVPAWRASKLNPVDSLRYE